MRLLAVSSTVLATSVWISSGCMGHSPPQVSRAGERATTKTTAVESGTRLIQGKAPISVIGTYLDGFHIDKESPERQAEAHHYCNQVNEDFAQCVLFDGNTRDANMIGIEYVISERLFDTLPSNERHLWHPHNYEVLSGQLVAPGLPDVAEKQVLRQYMNTYGKTWSLWRVGNSIGATGDKLPLGTPRLMWSANADNEIDQRLLDDRKLRMNIDTQAKRDSRADLTSMAHPQEGVDALARAFPRRRLLPGVTDKTGSPRTSLLGPTEQQ